MNLLGSQQRSRLKSIRLPLIIVIVTFTIIYLLMATRPRLEPVQAPERVWNVDVVVAEHRTIQPTLNLFGEVIAGRRSELRPAVSGVMVEIGENFRDGGVVRKGELLVQIDPFDYEIDLAEQRSMRVEAEVRLEMLHRDLDRAKELYAAKNVSEQFLDAAQLDVLQQEAIVEQRGIGVRRAEHELKDSRLVAPFDGVVANANAALGKQFSGFGADMIGELIDTSRVEVRFSLTNAQFGRLLESEESIVGRFVTITWQVGESALEFDAVIERIGAEITSTTGGVDVYAIVDTGGQQSRLRPGAFVGVGVADKRYESMLRAPDTAVYGENTVFVIEDDRLAERRIDIFGYAGNDVLFRSTGPTPIVNGDRIVTTQLREGGPGTRVSVR